MTQPHRSSLNALLMVACMGVSVADAGQEAKYKGEFILSRNEYQNPVCQQFTRNLNQFRKLDFATCHPRLSEKYPEFTRPEWEEIPFDMTIAENVIKGSYGNWRTNARKASLATEHWKKWSEQVQPFVASGQARMWRTRLDFDGDGLEETIYRMIPNQGIDPVSFEKKPPWNCDYHRGQLHMTGNIRDEAEDYFNSGSELDIVRYAGDGRYYWVGWSAFGPAYPFIDIGATAGVEMRTLSWSGIMVIRSTACLIDWVPTGKYKPLKRTR